MTAKKQPESGGFENISTRRRDFLKVLAAGAVVYSTPVISSFTMEGLRFDQAHAGFSQNQTGYSHNQIYGFFYNLFNWLKSKFSFGGIT